jgi:hypothetical protein
MAHVRDTGLVVGQLGGEIIVESKPGVGTTFDVRLPRWVEDVAGEESEEKRHVKALVSG